MFRRVLNKLYQEFIYGGHLLSLGASGLVLCVLLIADIEFSLEILIIPYLISQIVYGIDHISDKKERKSNIERSDFLKNSKYYKSFMAFYILSLLLLSFNNLPFLLFSSLFILSGFIYSFKLKGLTSAIPLFKTFYVSFFWGLIVFIPAVYFSDLSQFNLLLFFSIFIFFRFLMSTAFFDLKDIESDKERGLKTFPLVFKEKTFLALHVLNILGLVPLVAGILYGILPFFLIGLSSLIIINFVYLVLAKKNSGKVNFISYVLIDGEYVAWPLIVITSKALIG